jgi:hypothetical protein
MRLSVVLTVVDGAGAVESCLAALAAQDTVDPIEVIVPWDDSIPAVGQLAPRFPYVKFLGIGRLETQRPLESAAGQHELFDRRRTAGLLLASGDVVSILEDRGRPRTDWARALLSAHARLPHAVIGGAIENGREALLNWAVYFCDFSRYQRPFEAGPRTYVSDVNIGYKRSALTATADLWRDRYHETTVHWALQRRGEVLYLTPEPVVDQFRGSLQLAALLSERFAWGRLFAYTRAREQRVTTRLACAVMAPLLPLLLFVRHLRLQSIKTVRLRTFLRASPLVFALLAAWSLGEALGYLTGTP